MPEALYETITQLPAIRFGENEEPSHWRAGDFILTHQDLLFSKVIRFGQRLRFRGPRRKFAHYNHAAFIVKSDGTIIEALGRGLTVRNVKAYKPTEYVVVHPDGGIQGSYNEHDRQRAVRFATYVQDRGVPYGFLTIVSIGLRYLFGTKISFAREGQKICSQFVAEALEHGGVIFDFPASHAAPADLAATYNVFPKEYSNC